MRQGKMVQPTSVSSGYHRMITFLCLLLVGCGGNTSAAITDHGEPATCCKISDVEIGPAPVILTEGSTTALDLEVRASDSSRVTRSGNWWIRDPSIARVTSGDSPPVVEGVRAGSTEVVAAVDEVADTADVVVVGPDFGDGFESGDVSHTENGYGWGGGVNASVVADAARTGSYGLRLTHPGKADGEDSVAQIDLQFGDQLSELWIEFWIRIPENYNHRDQDGARNNKFFQYWGGSRSSPDVKMISEIWPVGGITSDQDEEESYLTWVPPGGSGHETIQDPFIVPSDHGQWIQLRWHGRVADMGEDNGVVEVWKNQMKIYSDAAVEDYHADSADSNHFDALRLLGWANSGFDEDTHFDFDGLKIYTQNPGW